MYCEQACSNGTNIQDGKNYSVLYKIDITDVKTREVRK